MSIDHVAQPPSAVLLGVIGEKLTYEKVSIAGQPTAEDGCATNN